MKTIAENKPKRGRPPAVTVEEIYELQSKGYSQAQIAEMKGVSRQAVYQKVRNYEIKKGLLTPVDEAVRKLANPATREIANKMGDKKVKRFVAYHVDLFMMGQGCDKSDVPGLYERFKKYLVYCTENGVVPNNMSAYLDIGVHKDEITQWSRGVSGTPEHQKFAREVQAFFSSIHEQGGTDGPYHRPDRLKYRFISRSNFSHTVSNTLLKYLILSSTGKVPSILITEHSIVSSHVRT